MSDSNSIFIGDLERAAVLAALYNGARVQGAGFMRYQPGSMTVEQAQEVIAGEGAATDYPFASPHDDKLDFDYLHGRVIKCNLGGESFHPGAYDMDNGGEGTAQRIIDKLRESGNVADEEIVANHTAGTQESIRHMEGVLDEGAQTRVGQGANFTVIQTGVDFLPKGFEERLGAASEALEAQEAAG